MSDLTPVAAGERALQLVVRVEKASPPDLIDVYEAAAMATVGLLDDPRSHPQGAWHDEVAVWNGARIRKLVRRARGAAWGRVCELDGVTAHVGSASVRAFVPGLMDEAPAELAKLQIQSSPLPAPPIVDDLVATDEPTVIIAVDPAIDLSWGKCAAQVAHAAQRGWESFTRTERLDWNAAGRPLRVLSPTPALWGRLLPDARVTIHDGGFTEVAPGTRTALALYAPADR